VVARSKPAELSEARHVAVDLRDAKAVDGAVATLRERSPPFRNLVFLQRRRAEDVGDPWREELAISVEATRTIVEGLIVARDKDVPGAIVMVSSLAADFVADDQPLAYHVVKAALNAMVRYYAVQLAPDGIRVNGVTPGLVRKQDAGDPGDAGAIEARARRTPLRRMATANEVSDVIAYVCSEQASFITGQVIVVDGGMSLIFQGSLT
jgi:NAD(P)-dependent dehydrogenase (short-subunit alcohol dehydrogenase family)